MGDGDRTDRELLEGVFAYQLGFVGRPDFVAAVSAWLQDDEQGLGTILQRRQRLSTPAREHLVALADMHLRRYGGKLQMSLAALESSYSLRGELRRLARARLDGEAELTPMSREVLAPLLAESFEAVHDVRTSATLSREAATGTIECSAPNEATDEGAGRARFRVLRSIAEGSLGCVSIGRDEEFQRDVAIKEIKPQYAQDPACRSRFVLEAEITQALEHPGIAPVYGVGYYEDGRPFYAMRLVRGVSLKEAIQAYYGTHVATGGEVQRTRRSRRRDYYALEFRKLLGRLVDVCHAIEFAHRRGVLHRDLKPGNIMLGELGDTVVVDWGLAKVAGAADVDQLEGELADAFLSGSGSMTQIGAVIGTPAYMSPEQAAGARDTLGVEADVYGLGATLYHLLTGQAPFAKQPLRDMLARVRRGEFATVRQVNPAAPPALAAICHKAMALAPHDRYRTVAELRDELERWLADEDVQVYDEGQWVKSARWVRHNMATYTLSLICFLAVFILGFAERSRRLAAENAWLRLEAAAEDRGLPRDDGPRDASMADARGETRGGSIDSHAP